MRFAVVLMLSLEIFALASRACSDEPNDRPQYKKETARLLALISIAANAFIMYVVTR